MTQATWHFSGIGGAGMNPLARLMAARGIPVQGSDRSFDQGQNQALKAILEADGIRLLPQDGSAITADLDRVVHSTAVEEDTPELQAAIAAGVRRQTRPALLAELLNAASPGIAVAGTSGKSTVVGMIAWILRCAARPATVLGGAALAEAGATHMGCFAAAPAEAPLLAEACECDGTLVNYRPAIGLVHNITRDHSELEELMIQFGTFAGQSELLLVDSACPQASSLAAAHPRALRYGPGDEADIRLEVLRPGPWRAQGVVDCGGEEVFIDLPQPGEHNLRNACAAVAVADHLGIERPVIAEALRTFPGVARRFQVLGTNDSGMRVVDDYAHNADKIRAAITAAQEGCDRLVAIFQPHGFGPARFLRDELKALLPELLREQDRFCYSEIYYAGGTVAQDISSKDLADDLAPLRARGCGYAEDHRALLDWVCETAIPGDTVLLMGARDPRLPGLAKAIHDLL